jgi:predicted Zn-dependent protease
LQFDTTCELLHLTKLTQTHKTNMSKIGFHKNFKNPTAKERTSALGSFPFEHKSNSSREQMLAKSAELGQPSLRLRAECLGIEDATDNLAASDLDERKLYKPTSRSQNARAIPKPSDELDWLAQVPEEGQTFDDYVSFMTTRSTGRIRPIANAEGLEILILPITVATEYPPQATGSTGSNVETVDDAWPNYGPPLSPLVKYTEAFFDRKVRVLPAAQVYVDKLESEKSTTNKRKRRKVTKKKTSEQLGAFASSTKKGRFKLFLPQSDGSFKSPVNIAGRADLTSDRVQIQVTSLLDELSRYRFSREDTNAVTNEKEFCIMGITMIDLYDGPKDLFCAGMAFGGDKVAAFSFHRYHPFLKMHPEQWHNYGYEKFCDGYSYYNNDNQNPQGLSHHPPAINGETVGENTIGSEFLRRSSKLLSHELGHLYVLDHCIHNKCLMMGTGHLVEDFNAPSHLCGVCLRKLQWRTGFDVKYRYKLLAIAFDKMGMISEKDWVLKQFNHLS